MAKARYNRKALEKAMKLDEQTLKRINFMGTTVESLTPEELELEIPANRPDLLSTGGFLRAFKAFEGRETGLKQYKRITAKGYAVIVDKSVKSVRPFTACAVVENLSLNTDDVREIIALQEKLHGTLGRNRKKCAIGIYPLDKVAFPIRYEARKPADIVFTPLGGTKPMTAETILQKHPIGKEYASLLKEAARYPLFVDAKKNILSMPPIINSEETGHVTEKTKGVFIECSGYDQATLEKAIVILATELADRGGIIHGVKIKDTAENITPSFEPTKMKIKKEAIEKLLGLELSEKELEKLLAKMGHEYKAGGVYSPAWRADILHEVDLAEDVAIAYGYDNLKPLIPPIATIGESSLQTKTKTQLREILNGLGMLELSSLHFITKEEAERAEEKKLIEVENPRTEYALLRPTLTIPALRTLAANRDAEYPQNLYELGPVFYANSEQNTGVEEEEHLLIALTPGNFTKAKEILDYLTRMTNCSYTVQELELKKFVSGRTGAVVINNIPVGHIGEVHPHTLHEWKLRMPLAIIELKLEPFLRK